MIVSIRVLTFAAGAQQFPAPTGFGLVSRITAVPLRSNTHPCWVGLSNVTNDASGTGVIKDLATPPAATAQTELFEAYESSGDNTIDPTVFYGHGTSSEKLIVTYYQR